MLLHFFWSIGWSGTLAAGGLYEINLADTTVSREIRIISSSTNSLAEQNAFIQSSLTAEDPSLVFAGYSAVGDATPEPVENNAWLAVEAGTIFGVEVEELDFLVGNGTGFDVKSIEAVSKGVVVIPDALSTSLSARSHDYKSDSFGLISTSGSVTNYSFSVIPGQQRDSISVIDEGNENYSVVSSGTSALLSAAFEKSGTSTDPDRSEFTVLNQRAGNNVKVINQTYIASVVPEVSDSLIDFGMEGTYFVSSSEGHDSNDGLSPDRPKKTIAAAVALMPEAGEKVSLKAGDIFEETLNVPLSGSVGSPVVYGAYGIGEKPVISGASDITGWESYKGSIYRAKVGTDVGQVFVDSEPLEISRYPREGYLTISSVQTTTEITSNEINTGIDYAGSKLLFKPNSWSLMTVDVLSSSGGDLTTTAPTSYAYKQNWGFFMLNNASFMTYPGCWYYNSSDGYLYVWLSDSSSPSKRKVAVSVRNTLELGTRKAITIENLNLNASAGHGIDSSPNGGGYITIKNCEINYSCKGGIFLNSQNDYSEIVNNQITNSKWDGIRTIYCDNLDISYNRIENSGLLYSLSTTGTRGQQSGNGISASYSTPGTSHIHHNYVEKAGYCGMVVNGLIEYNVTRNVCLTIDDGGGIYSQANGSIIRYNIIENAFGTTEGEAGAGTTLANGIYFDDNMDRGLAENNFIVRCVQDGIVFHNTTNCMMKNNYVVQCYHGLKCDSDGKNGNSAIGNTVVELNTYLTDYNTYGSLVNIRNRSTVSEWDANTYYTPYNTKPFVSASLDPIYSEFPTWRSNSGLDANSEIYEISKGEEEIYYNETPEIKTVILTGTYYNLKGEQISNVILSPYTGVVVVKAK